MNRQAGCDASTNFGGGNGERKTGENPSTERRWSLAGAVVARAPHYHKLGELSQRFGVAPFGQVRDVIGTDEVEKFRVRITLGITLDGIDAVGGGTTEDLLVIEMPGALTCESQS